LVGISSNPSSEVVWRRSVRKLWYAGAGVIAGGLLFLGAAPAQADVTIPDPGASITPYADPVGDALARTNGLRLASPVGSDPLGRAPLLTLGQGDQQLFQVKPGQNGVGRILPGHHEERPEAGGQRQLPSADVVGTEFPKAAGVPFTDANSGSVRLPLVRSLPIVGGILPDGSHTLESTSSQYPLLDDLDGSFSVRGLPKRLADSNRTSLAGLPLGGSPVSPADLLPEAVATGRATPAPYASTPAGPAVVSPSVVPSSEAPVAVVPSAEVPSAEAPSAAAPASVLPSVLPSEAPYTKSTDDPRLMEEPVEGLTR
jgi:hypothetical protein